jgi:hypothetical protein
LENVADPAIADEQPTPKNMLVVPLVRESVA